MNTDIRTECEKICVSCGITIDKNLNDEEYYKELANRVTWYHISKYQKLSEGFIREFADRVYWKYISQYQKLSEEFIRELADKVYWDCISMYQKLSEGFIREFADRFDWDNISRYQKLSERFRKEYNIEIPDSNWLYKTAKNKRVYLDKYEIEGDYVIAYKSCRSDGYSKYNFQYKYEVGKEYTAHCDCNVDNENSFGLSAGTKEHALSYCKEKLFKVKIHIDDIGAVVHNGEKIRCSKLCILEEV